MKAQPSSLEGVNATLKASGDYLKSVYTQANGWATDIPEGDRKATPVTVSDNTILKGAVDGDNLRKFFDTGGNFEMALMDKLHLDIYPTVLNEDGKLGVFFYSRAISNWTGAEIDVTANQWNSIDIDLSDYKATTLSPISAFAISGGVGNKDAGTDFVNFAKGAEVYIANAYFYNDGTSPKVSATLVYRNHNSVTFNVKGFKSATGSALKYIVKYGNTTKEFTETNADNITVDGLIPQTDYTFEITVNDETDKPSNTVTISTNTLEEPTAKPTSVPDLKSDETHNLYIKGKKSNGFNFYDWGGAQKGPNTGEKDINETDKAFFIENHEWYGSGFDKVDATGMMLHVDVYPLHTDVPLSIVPITRKEENGKEAVQKELNGQDFKLKKGEWNGIDINMDEYPEGSNITDLFQIKFIKSSKEGQVNADGTQSFYIGNVYLYVPDDGEDPEISSTLVKAISVGSATFEIVANDNSDELKYKVVAVDKVGNTYSAEVKGGKGYPVTLRIEGLVHNTTYTATVTVSDGFRSTTKEGTFTTKELPHAVKLSPAATKYYYDNHADALDAHIRGYVTSGDGNVGSFDDHDGFDVKEITIGNVIENDKEIPDNVLKFTGKKGGTFTDAFGIGILGTDEFGINDGKDYLVRFAIYPVDIDEIEYAGKIYLKEDNFKTRKVIPNQWNYISFKPLENYEGNNNFTGILIRCKKGKTVYLDNFCYYTSSDKTPPVITEYKIGKTFATSASMSIKGYDKNGENQSLTGMLKYEIWVEDANGTRQAALVRGENNVENPVEVAAYVRGIAPDADNKAKIWVIARDAAENQAETEKVEVTFATVLDKSINVESFEEKENIEDAYNVTDKSVVLTDKSHGGLIILNGQWDATEFNKIAAKYPYSCFDMRNVKFTDDNRIDHGDGTNGTITVFNPNTYFITDVTNKFDGNYATYEADGSLMAMNMHWFDGEWKWDGDDVPDGRVNYKKIVKDNTKEGETYLGISSFGYIKLDPYTGFDLVVREQGCGITRDVKVPEKENKYSTVICPFSLNTSSDYVAGSRFYELETPSVITDGENNTTVTLNFTEITGKTKPNTPYLVRLAEGTKSLYFVDEDKDIKKTIVFPENVEEMKGDIATGGNVSAYMFGTYITRTLSGPTDVYGLKQGNQTLTLVTPKEGKKIEIPAFRAAMKLTQIPSNAKSILISFDGETTGITSIDNDVINAVLGNIYSIDGKKVGNTSDGMINLPAGIYIVNGKKVVVK